MKIGIVGGGTVGRATARAFIEHVDEVRVYDRLPERSTVFYLSDVLKCDIVFVCLPTPKKRDSLECDTSVVDLFFAGIIPDFKHVNFVLRSTVPIGTTRRLAEQNGLINLVHSPEFLTARCSVTDAHLPARNIIGIPRLPSGPSFKPVLEGSQPLIRLYLQRFPGVQLHVVNSDESEAVKLFTNGFFTTKIAYFNECRTLADELDLDWIRVMEGVLSDGRIAHSHTRVPGPDGKLGFGGECLTKDLASLVYQLVERGLDASVSNAVRLRNLGDRERTP